MERDFLSLRITQPVNDERCGSRWNIASNRYATHFTDSVKITQPELHANTRPFADVQTHKAASHLRQDGAHLRLSRYSAPESQQHKAVSPLLSATNQGAPVRFPSKGSELTIFFGGKVAVYDGVSAQKAQELMSMAEELSKRKQIQSAANLKAMNMPTPMPSLSPDSATFSNSVSVEDSIQKASAYSACSPAPSTTIMLSIPQARKASLARFLEKRKQRVNNAAPYCVIKGV